MGNIFKKAINNVKHIKVFSTMFFKKNIVVVELDSIKPETLNYTEIAEGITEIPHKDIWKRIKPKYNELKNMEKAVDGIRNKYTFSILVHDNGCGKANETIQALQKQVYKGFEVNTFVYEQELLAILKSEKNDYVAIIEAGDIFYGHALFEVLVALNQLKENPMIIYFDHHHFENGDEIYPVYKPSFNEKYLELPNFIGRACFFNSKILEKINIIKEELTVDALALEMQRLCSKTGYCHHIPGILFAMPYVLNIGVPRLEDSDNPFLKNVDGIVKENPQPLTIRMLGAPTLSKAGINKIIIVMMNGIGDAVNALSSIKKIRSYFPSAQVDLICSPRTAELFAAQPELNNIIEFNYFHKINGIAVDTEKRDLELEKVLEYAKLQQYDLAIELRKFAETYNFTIKLAPIALTATSGEPVNFWYEGRRKETSFSNVENVLDIIDILGFEDNINSEIHIPEKDIEKMENFIKNSKILEHPLVIGVHPGAGYNIRRWPISLIADFCELLIREQKARIVFFGGEFEKEIYNEIMERIGPESPIISLIDQLNLLEFAYFVQKLDYFVASDSGPMHIAAAQGTPTLCVFGPGNVDEWAPKGRTLILRKEMLCSPCNSATDTSECGHRECLNGLTGKDLQKGATKLMALFPK